jgi:hypothetical protein
MEKGKRRKISLTEIKEFLISFFLKREEVLLAYLFGSSLRGKMDEKTDIDIAILIDPELFNRLDSTPPYGYEAEMISELIRLLKHNLVDLVLLNKATPLLAYEVIHHGRLLLSRSEELRIKFEISSLKRHADTKHLRDIKRIYSKRRTEKGLSAYA